MTDVALTQIQSPQPSEAPAGTPALSYQQQCVLAFMWAFFCHNHQLPRLVDISAAFGWTSGNAAHDHIRRLERKGMLERNEIGTHKFSDVGLACLAAAQAGDGNPAKGGA